jgi:hypothetical protein
VLPVDRLLSICRELRGNPLGTLDRGKEGICVCALPCSEDWGRLVSGKGFCASVKSEEGAGTMRGGVGGRRQEGDKCRV